MNPYISLSSVWDDDGVNNALFGRAAELDQACKALVADDPGVVVIEGPAGIGKSALWRSLIDRALAEEWAVLRAARGTERGDRCSRC